MIHYFVHNDLRIFHQIFARASPLLRVWTDETSSDATTTRLPHMSRHTLKLLPCLQWTLSYGPGQPSSTNTQLSLLAGKLMGLKETLMH